MQDASFHLAADDAGKDFRAEGALSTSAPSAHTPRMNPEIKAQWIAALRSGEFSQGRGELLTQSGEFCCLGVLCELHHRQVGGEWRPASEGRVSMYMGEVGSIPHPVQEWAGIKDHNPRVEIAGVDAPLACHNDGREAAPACTFAQIADAIEGQL